MKVNNKKETVLSMYGYILLILLDVVFLLFAEKLFHINSVILKCSFVIVFLFSIWRIAVLKTFYMEISEQFLSIKYSHPLLKNSHPVLEVPLRKVISYKIEKGIINSIFNISITTKRGIRSFYYKMGTLPNSESEKIKKFSDIFSSSKSDEEIVA